MFFALELVRAEQLETTLGFLFCQTLVVALKELEDILHDDGLEVDLFLVVEILRSQLNLRHIHLGVYPHASTLNRE